MIIGGNYADNNGAKIDLLSGFSDSIRGNSGIRLETTVQVPDSGYFAAENIIRNILNEYPDVNTVVSTGADDTMEIHQVLNDLNKEGRITLIGYGNTLQLRNYIKNGDVFGSIYEDSENTGYFSVESLVRCLGGQKLQSFIDTGVYTVARSNLESFSLGT
jgi:ribose transport system substrate-binding protein